MAPIAVEPPSYSSTAAPLAGKMDDFDPGKVQTGAKSMNFPAPPVWPVSPEGKLMERKHKLERLAGAFRIAGKLGYDEGVRLLRLLFLPCSFC